MGSSGDQCLQGAQALEKPPWGSMVRMGHTSLCPHKLSLFLHGAKPHPASCSGFSFYRGLGALRELPGLCLDPKGGTWGDIILIFMYLFHILNVFSSSKPSSVLLFPPQVKGSVDLNS